MCFIFFLSIKLIVPSDRCHVLLSVFYFVRGLHFKGPPIVVLFIVLLLL